MSDDLSTVGVELEVRRAYYESKILTKEESEQLEPLKVLVRADHTNLPKGSVTYDAGFTQGLPNFSSCRVSMAVTLPCLPEEIDDALAACKQVVDTELISQREQLNSASG